MSGRTRLTGREQPPLSLVQNWLKRLEASLDGGSVNHSVRISAPAAESRQFPSSFVAFLPVSRFFSADSVVLAQALRPHPTIIESVCLWRSGGWRVMSAVSFRQKQNNQAHTEFHEVRTEFH
jgi:hypothetical protein